MPTLRFIGPTEDDTEVMLFEHPGELRGLVNRLRDVFSEAPHGVWLDVSPGRERWVHASHIIEADFNS